MSPAAIYEPSTFHPDSSKTLAAVPVKGPALAIGSLATAQDGQYQSLVSELEESRQVDKQMLDRLVDRGQWELPPRISWRVCVLRACT